MERQLRKIIRESIDGYLNEFDLQRQSGLLKTKSGDIYYEYHCDETSCKLDLYSNSKEGKIAPDETLEVSPEREQKLLDVLKRLDIRNMNTGGGMPVRTPYKDNSDLKTAFDLNITE